MDTSSDMGEERGGGGIEEDQRSVPPVLSELDGFCRVDSRVLVKDMRCKKRLLRWWRRRRGEDFFRVICG